MEIIEIIGVCTYGAVMVGLMIACAVAVFKRGWFMFAVIDSNGTVLFRDEDRCSCEIEMSGYLDSGYSDLEVIEED